MSYTWMASLASTGPARTTRRDTHLMSARRCHESKSRPCLATSWQATRKLEIACSSILWTRSADAYDRKGEIWNIFRSHLLNILVHGQRGGVPTFGHQCACSLYKHRSWSGQFLYVFIMTSADRHSNLTRGQDVGL